MSQSLTQDGQEIATDVSDELQESGLEHISKSRIKLYLECPRKFYWKYWAENRPPGSYHTEKGSEIHRVYETFHENLIEYVEEHGERPERFAPLMGGWKDYAQWLEPHIRNFWEFEDTRWDLAKRYAEDNHPHSDANRVALSYWLPYAVEAEGEITGHDIPIGNLPWMGYADAILPAVSVPQVNEENGVVILDYKTGKVQDPKYRDKGIYLEGEYYGWLFENSLDEEVVGVAGYYPQEDELVVSPYPNEKRRHEIRKAVLGMQQPPDEENYEIDTGPLCHYGHGKCFFYDVCESDWGMKGGVGYHGFAEPDGSTKPKDEITQHKRDSNYYPY